MFTSAIKKQTSICCSISLNTYMVFQIWNHEKKEKIVLAYIADVSVSTNPSYICDANIVFKKTDCDNDREMKVS